VSFYDQTLQVIDETSEIGKLHNIERKAGEVDGKMAKLDQHVQMTWRQATHIFVSGFRMIETLLSQFGMAVPPVIGAIIGGLPPLVSALIAFGAAETTLGNWVAGAAVALAVSSIIAGIAATAQSQKEVERAIREGQRTTQSILSFANSWRALY
jgi:hypothetical protein